MVRLCLHGLRTTCARSCTAPKNNQKVGHGFIKKFAPNAKTTYNAHLLTFTSKKCCPTHLSFTEILYSSENKQFKTTCLALIHVFDPPSWRDALKIWVFPLT